MVSAVMKDKFKGLLVRAANGDPSLCTRELLDQISDMPASLCRNEVKLKKAKLEKMVPTPLDGRLQVASDSRSGIEKGFKQSLVRGKGVLKTGEWTVLEGEQ